MTRETFLQSAAGLPVEIAEIPLLADVKQFSTGSLGWYGNGKINVRVGDELVRVQVGVTLTVIGSKEWTKGGDA